MSGDGLSQLLEQGYGEILDDWERRARKALREVAGTPRLILRNYLIDYLNRLREAFDRLQAGGDPAASVEGLVGDAAVHGQLRATTPNYDLHHVMTEYRILREVTREYLERHRQLYLAEREVLIQVTELHTEAAAKAFAESITRVQGAVARSIGGSLLPAIADLREELHALRSAAGGVDGVDRCLQLADRLLARTDSMTLSVYLQPGEMLPLRLQEGDACAVVEDVVHAARLAYGEAVRLEAPECPLTACFSRAGLERALENLIDNAIRYGERDAHIDVRLHEQDASFVVGVHNRGRPIPAAERERIFAPFERGGSHADEGPGWGLGLSLVADVVKAHGGHVELSDTEEGTDIALVLPKSGPPERELYLLADGAEVPARPQGRERT